MRSNTVIMVDDAAYVGYELRCALIKRGFNVKHFHFGTLPSKIETVKMAVKLRFAEADILHAHFCRSSAYAAFGSGKPYIVHCHGTDIRHGLNRMQKISLKKAKRILVSTPDLLSILPDAIWLPNPIAERFKPMIVHDGNKVLYFSHWYEDLSGTLAEMCKKYGFDLTVPKYLSIPYAEMHIFLNQFDIFIDRFNIRSFSKTALEAMACGLAVIGYDEPDLEMSLKRLIDMDEREKLVKSQKDKILPQHEIESVVNRLIEIYQEVIE